MIGHVSYGQVTLEIVKANEVSRTPILDDSDCDYRFTEWVFDYTCIYSPSATSFSGIAANIPQPGRAFGPQTDSALIAYLSQPRLQLKVESMTEGGQVYNYLVSPPQGCARDAKTGPIVERVNIIETLGIRTWIVLFRVKTWTNDAPTKDSPLISHRWRKSADIDCDGLTTITTNGLAHFHGGRLYQNFDINNQGPASPDHFRNIFLCQLRNNFKRESIEVTVSEDNTTAEYVVIDREKIFNAGFNGPAHRVEALLTTGYSQGSFQNVTQSAVEGVMSQASQISADPFHDIGVVIGMLNRVGGAVTSNLPRYFVNAKVRAYGGSGSTRSELLNYALGIAIAKAGSDSAFFSRANASEIIVTQDCSGKEVTVDMTLRYTNDCILTYLGNGSPGNPGQAANFALVVGLLATSGQMFYRQYFPANENVIAIPNTQGVLSQSTAVGNRPPNPGGGVDTLTRGPGYLRDLIVQALMTQGQTPATPTQAIA